MAAMSEIGGGASLLMFSLVTVGTGAVGRVFTSAAINPATCLFDGSKGWMSVCAEPAGGMIGATVAAPPDGCKAASAGGTLSPRIGERAVSVGAARPEWPVSASGPCRPARRRSARFLNQCHPRG